MNFDIPDDVMDKLDILKAKMEEKEKRVQKVKAELAEMETELNTIRAEWKELILPVPERIRNHISDTTFASAHIRATIAPLPKAPTPPKKIAVSDKKIAEIVKVFGGKKEISLDDLKKASAKPRVDSWVENEIVMKNANGTYSLVKKATA